MIHTILLPKIDFRSILTSEVVGEVNDENLELKLDIQDYVVHPFYCWV